MTYTKRAGLEDNAPLAVSALQQSPTSAASGKDAAMASIVRGLNLLASHARHHGLGNAARILASAKEDLVYWAADMNFHESSKDRFTNQPMYEVPTDISSALLHCLNGLNEGPERRALVQEFTALMERARMLATHQQAADSD